MLKLEDLDEDVQLLLTGWNEHECNPYSSVGRELKNNNKSIAAQLIAAINNEIQTEEDLSSSLALECLANCGHEHFQDLIDRYVFAAFESKDDQLVFCAVACYHELSKEIQIKSIPILKNLCNHSDRDVSRASQFLIDHLELEKE